MGGLLCTCSSRQSSFLSVNGLSHSLPRARDEKNNDLACFDTGRNRLVLECDSRQAFRECANASCTNQQTPIGPCSLDSPRIGTLELAAVPRDGRLATPRHAGCPLASRGAHRGAGGRDRSRMHESPRVPRSRRPACQCARRAYTFQKLALGR